MSETSSPEVIARLMQEGVISASAAARLLPPCRGKKRHNSSIVRWILAGKRGIKLEGFRGGDSCWWTSRQALARFFARLTALDTGEALPLPEEADRRKRSAEAIERIRELGKQRR